MIELSYAQIYPVTRGHLKLQLQRESDLAVYSMQIMSDEPDSAVVSDPYEFQLALNSLQGELVLRVNQRKVKAFFAHKEDKIYLQIEGETYIFQRVLSYALEDHTGSNASSVLAPMPGKILKVSVELGQFVEKEQELFVMESMKMESSIKSLREGIIEELLVCEGDLVQADQLLLSYSGEDGKNSDS